MSATTPVRIPVPPPHGPRRRLTAAVAALAVALVGAVVAATLLTRPPSGDRDPSAVPIAGSTSATAGSTSAIAGSTSAPDGSTSAPSRSSFAPATGVSGPGFGFVPLWPFRSAGEAAAWQTAATPGGHQPWHLDAAQTAVAFATGYLGYARVDQVTSRRVAGDEAWIGVGGRPVEGRQVSAAVLHLARIGAGPAATRPWEVVGSEDTDLTLDEPRYGSVVAGPVTVGGTVTGVDETLAVQVRSLDAGELARVGGIGAGGTRQPWHVTLTLAAGDGPLTVAVATGGHLAIVERFAITGLLRTGSGGAAGYPTAEAAVASTVAHGVYVGDCDASVPPATPAAGGSVCSVLLRENAGRRLYRVGYAATDAGHFAVVARRADGRWVVRAGAVAGADVPADLGGPIAGG